MITKLEIQNFQGHKHSVLEFSNGVNVIVGITDAGKSAIIRALRWAATNRPSGDQFISWWGGETSVRIDTPEVFVKRIKSNNKNEYWLAEAHMDETWDEACGFKAIGTDVPEEIAKALNLSSINIQGQLDRHFLLSASPGEVAAHWNNLAKIGKIDTSLKAIQSVIRSTEQALNARRGLLEQYKQELTAYKYLVSVKEDLALLNALEQEKKALECEYGDISTTLETITNINTEMADLKKQARLGTLVDTVLVNIEKRKQLNVAADELLAAENKIKQIDDAIKSNKQNLTELEATFAKNFPKVCPLCGKAE